MGRGGRRSRQRARARARARAGAASQDASRCFASVSKPLLLQALKCMGTWARKRVRELRKWTWNGDYKCCWDGHQQEAAAIAVLPGGRVVTGGCPDGELKVWAIETGICLKTIETHDMHDVLGSEKSEPTYRGINCLSVLSDGRVVAAGPSFKAGNEFPNCHTIWDLETEQVVVTEGYQCITSCLLALGDSKYVSSDCCCHLKLWDGNTGARLSSLELFLDTSIEEAEWDPRSLLELPNGDLALLFVAGYADSYISLLRVTGDELVPVRRISLPRPRVLGFECGRTRHWSMVKIGTSNQVLIRLKSDDGTDYGDAPPWKEAEASGLHQIWDLDLGSCLHHQPLNVINHAYYDGVTKTSDAIAVLPDGRFVVPGFGATIVSDPPEGTQFRTWQVQHRYAPHASRPMEYHDGYEFTTEEVTLIYAIAALGGDRYLTAANDGTFKVWTAPPVSSPARAFIFPSSATAASV